MKLNVFFIVFEGLPSGEKWKFNKKIADTSFNKTTSKEPEDVVPGAAIFERVFFA